MKGYCTALREGGCQYPNGALAPTRSTMICSARAAAMTVAVWWSVARAPRSIPGHCSECFLCIRHQRSDLFLGAVFIWPNP